jgi:hypothetical protein
LRREALPRRGVLVQQTVAAVGRPHDEGAFQSEHPLREGPDAAAARRKNRRDDLSGEQVAILLVEQVVGGGERAVHALEDRPELRPAAVLVGANRACHLHREEFLEPIAGRSAADDRVDRHEGNQRQQEGGEVEDQDAGVQRPHK